MVPDRVRVRRLVSGFVSGSGMVRDRIRILVRTWNRIYFVFSWSLGLCLVHIWCFYDLYLAS